MGRPPCCDKEGVKKGPWTPEEDILLVSYIHEHGPGNWRAVPTNTGLLRCSKSCRLRWTNYLRPGIRRGNFTDQEEKTIIHLQALLGNRWAAIASYLPQRTDNDIKNYWNTHLNKKLKKLQTGLEGHPRDGFAASQKMPRGQWEKRLQTDIHTAKQALREALSPEKPSYMSGSKSSDVCYSANPAQSSTYASSTENISRLLQGWKRNPPKPSQTNSVMTQNSFNNMSSTDSVSSDQGTSSWKSNDKDLILPEAFDSLFCFESFDSSHSDTSQSMSPEATLFQAESKPDSCAQLPFSLLEKWLFDEGASQGKDFLNDITLDDSANLF